MCLELRKENLWQVPTPEANQSQRLQLGAEKSQPLLGGRVRHQVPAGLRSPTPTPAMSLDIPAQNAVCRAEPDRESASTPPLSPRLPNDRRGKFTSLDGVAFFWFHLAPCRRRPSLGSPSPARNNQDTTFICTLEPASQAWATCTASSGREPAPSPHRCPGSAVPAGCRSHTHLRRPSFLPCALLGGPTTGSEVHSGSGCRQAPRVLLHSACVGERAGESAARACASVCLCDVCVCVRVCESVCV